MKFFGIVLLCIQACLVQSIFGQCAGRVGTAYGYATPAVVAPYNYGTCGCGNYGYGNGYGYGLGGLYGSVGGVYGTGLGLGCGRGYVY